MSQLQRVDDQVPASEESTRGSGHAAAHVELMRQAERDPDLQAAMEAYRSFQPFVSTLETQSESRFTYASDVNG